MTVPNAQTRGDAPSPGQHLATISHEGRFWDVYLELMQDPRAGNAFRGSLLFSPSDLNGGERPTRTTTIIVESSFEDALRRARGMEDRQLLDLLRSTLPD